MKKFLNDIKARFGQWWPEVEPAVAIATVLAAMMLGGCAAALMGNAIDKGQALSAEQIKAYRDTDQDVYSCTKAGGPPPAGNIQVVIVPRGKPGPKFGDDCHIIQ